MVFQLCAILLLGSFIDVILSKTEQMELNYQEELQTRDNIIKSLRQENKVLRQELQKKETFLNNNQKLRETVKTLSSRGSRVPLNFTQPPSPELLHKYEFKKDLGIWKISFFTPSKDECGNNKGITASSNYVSPGYTIAVDTEYWKLGTIFYIEGWGVVEAMDTGSAVKGRNRADVYL